MNYKPKTSNFDQSADEIISDLEQVYEAKESVKDAIAEVIDEWVTDIIEEHLADRNLMACWHDDEDNPKAPELQISFVMGEKRVSEHLTDLWAKDADFTELLGDLLNSFAGCETDRIEKLAAYFDQCATQCRAFAAKLAKDYPE